jgi:hypothetical protein
MKDGYKEHMLSEHGMQTSNWKLKQAEADLKALKESLDHALENPMPPELVQYFIGKGINPFKL